MSRADRNASRREALTQPLSASSGGSADRAMESALYQGSYTSAIARARRIILAAGMSWAKKHGRYEPFCNHQTWTPGVRVTRIGVSDAVSLSVVLRASGQEYGGDAERRERLEIEARALAILREAGLPFDHRGWLECAWGRS